MARINKLIPLFGVLLLVVLFAGSGFWFSKYYGNGSVFVNSGHLIGDLGVFQYVFQPIFLGAYEHDGGVFVRTFFIHSYQVKSVDLWVSGKWKEVNLSPVKLISDNDTKLIASAADLNNSIAKGVRIKVEYMTGELNGQDDIFRGSEICTRATRVCNVFDAARENMDGLVKFSKNGDIAPGLKIPVLYLHTKLER